MAAVKATWLNFLSQTFSPLDDSCFLFYSTPSCFLDNLRLWATSRGGRGWKRIGYDGDGYTIYWIPVQRTCWWGFRDGATLAIAFVTRRTIDSVGKWSFSSIKRNFKLVYKFLFSQGLFAPISSRTAGKIEFYRCRVTTSCLPLDSPVLFYNGQLYHSLLVSTWISFHERLPASVRG